MCGANFPEADGTLGGLRWHTLVKVAEFIGAPDAFFAGSESDGERHEQCALEAGATT